MTLIREHDPFSGHREPVRFGDAMAEVAVELFPAEYANTPVVEPPAVETPAEVAPDEKPPVKPRATARGRRPRRAKTAPVKQ
jgi:hypothetical protein